MRTINVNKDEYIKICSSFIDMKGYVFLAKKFKITPQAVANWKRRGIPYSYFQYLNHLYKKDFESLSGIN